ncbi:MFS transporter [Nocardia sp. ET3-3]|uniref:MFS transporter n=1 Tax=Nocardia terrae TaxID=2675851 RepID=A0A7K1UTV1_9NOCA|nr:MFS transporter [Nocardia terrae]MVU77787.1 MFS transporter [Nocardia terrae]
MGNIPIAIRSAEASTIDAPNGLRRTLILALGTFAVGTDSFILAGFLPDLAESSKVSTATAGLAVTVFAGAYALGSPVLATLTARLPRRTLLVTALLVLALANLGSALAPAFWALLAARIVAALGAAAFTPNAGAAASALVRPEARARALAVVVGGLTIATALGVPLGDLLGQWLGWRSALTGVAIVCLLAAAGVAAWVPPLPGNPYVPLGTRLAVLRNRSVATVLPLTVLGMGAAYTVYAYAVPALGALGIGASSTAWVLMLYGVGAVAGNLSSGFATDRWGAARVLTAGYIVMAGSLGVLGALAATDTRVPALVGVLALGWGAASWCQTPPQQHRLIAAAPQESGLVVALNASCIYFGIGAGSLLGGATIGHGVAAMYALAAVLAVVALCYLRLTSASAR